MLEPISWGLALLNISKIFAKDPKELDEVERTLNGARTAYNLLNPRDLSMTANNAVIAPLVVMEQALLHQEYASDLLTIVQLRDIAATLSYIRQEGGASGVKIKSLINQINPNRAGNNDYLCLSGCENFGNEPGWVGGVSDEDRIGQEIALAKDKNDKKEKDSKDEEKPLNIKANYNDITEYVPLALGRIVEAYTNIDGKEVTFPLTFKQIVIPAATQSVELVFSASKIEDGWFARSMMFKSTEITLPEYLSGKDIIKDRFKLKDKDLTGYFKEVSDRETKNKRVAFKTMTASMNSLANCFIISSDTAKQIEISNGLSMQSRKSLTTIFERVRANTIVVCNEDRGTFTFFTYGGSIPETYTRSEIKIKSKKDNFSDLTSLLKLISAGA